MKQKDKRKSYSHQKVVTSGGDVLYFDGKFDPETKTMNVYQLYGDVSKFDDAYSTIASDYGCDKVMGRY